MMGVPSNSSPNLDGIEMAGRTVEKMLHGDGQFPALQDKLRVGMQLHLNSVSQLKQLVSKLYMLFFLFGSTCSHVV